MTVYIDALVAYWQKPKPGAERHFGNGKESCHLWADSEAELDAFAQRLRLKPAWAQRTRNRYIPVHYDLKLSKRKLAVAYGATEMSIPAYMRQVRERTTNEPTG